MPVKDSVHVVRMAAAALSAGAADDPRTVARLTASRGLWLTPHVAHGFGHNPFVFVPDRLAPDVTDRLYRYAKKAAELAYREATPENIADAAAVLDDILRPVAAAVAEPEGEAVVGALWAKQVPDFVLALDYTLDTDWSGDPAIYIWVVIRDDADPESDEFQAFVRQFEDRVWNALRAIRSNRIPYVRFRPASDAEALIAGRES